MTIVKFVITFFFSCFIVFGQSDIEHIFKVYPAWTTNFDKKTMDFSELIGGGPPKDGIPAIINPKFTTIEEAKIGWQKKSR